MTKYIFTGFTKIVDGVTLYQICAATDFYAQKPYDPSAADQFGFTLIRKGTLGGWLEGEENLSQDGLCWVSDNACVYGHAKVYEGGLVCEDANVFDEAQVNDLARVQGKATVCGHAIVSDNARVLSRAFLSTGFIGDRATISDTASISGNNKIEIAGDAIVQGNASLCSTGGRVYVTDQARIFGHARLYDGACIYDHAQISGHAQIYGSEICDFAEVDGATIVQDGSHIGGNAMVSLGKAGWIKPGTFIAGDACVTSAYGYLVLTIHDGISLSFFLTDRQQIEMFVYLNNGSAFEPLADGLFPLQTAITPDHLELALHDRDEPTLHTVEFRRLCLKAIKTAQLYFQQRQTAQTS